MFNYNGSDEQFLKAACEKYNLESIKVKWLDPLSRIQRTWKGLKKHKLEIVADYLEIDYKPHNAAQDSMATAKVIAITSIVNDYSVEDWGGKLVDTLSLKNIHNSNTVKTKTTSSLIDENYIPPSHYKGCSIVPTGVFSLVSRKIIKALILKITDKKTVVTSISKSTEFIVAGAKMGPIKKVKAEELGVLILTEEEFLNKVNYIDFIKK